jgi:hypothetical protein
VQILLQLEPDRDFIVGVFAKDFFLQLKFVHGQKGNHIYMQIGTGKGFERFAYIGYTLVHKRVHFLCCFALLAYVEQRDKAIRFCIEKPLYAQYEFVTLVEGNIECE